MQAAPPGAACMIIYSVSAKPSRNGEFQSKLDECQDGFLHGRLVDLVRWVEPESDLNDPNGKRNSPPRRKADPSMFDLAGLRKAGKRIAREALQDINGMFRATT